MGFFSPGALTDMPAVRVFSLYSAMAVLLDFLFQVTVFVAIMTLDAKREEVSKDILLLNQFFSVFIYFYFFFTFLFFLVWNCYSVIDLCSINLQMSDKIISVIQEV